MWDKGDVEPRGALHERDPFVKVITSHAVLCTN